MMGIWFFATAIGEFLAGKIGSLMSVPKEILAKNDPYFLYLIMQMSF